MLKLTSLYRLLVCLPLIFACKQVENHSGITFKFNNGAEPQGIDPALIQGVPQSRIYMALFEGLFIPDPQTAKPIPGIVEKWETTSDGLTYTFHLRESYWSDGAPVTAGDFEYGIKRQLAPETASPYAFMIAGMVKGALEYNNGSGTADNVAIKAINKRTLKITLNNPAPYFLEMLVHHSFAPAPRHVIDDFGDQWTKPQNFVSNGPFKLASWQPNNQMTVVKNDHYWDARSVKLDRIIFYPIDDLKTGYNMYKNGELDGSAAPPIDLMEELMLRDDFHIAPQISTYYYLLNTKKEPLNDRRVRKALSMAINRKALTEKVTKGGEAPTLAFVPPINGYQPVSGSEEDIAMAQNLLAQAGFPGGQGFPVLELSYNTSDAHKIVAEFIQQQWKTYLGINVILHNLEWKTFLDQRQRLNYDIARAGWAGDFADPLNFLSLFQGDSKLNNSGANNPRYNRILYESAKVTDPEKRFKLLQEAEKMLIKEGQVVIPLYYHTSKNLIDTQKWGGWHTNIMDYHPWKFLYKKQ